MNADRVASAIWMTAIGGLITWGVVACSMDAADQANRPAPDPYANIHTWCTQVGGTYVPAPATPSLPTVNGFRAAADMPKCQNSAGVEIPSTVENPDNVDVGPNEPADPPQPR